MILFAKVLGRMADLILITDSNPFLLTLLIVDDGKQSTINNQQSTIITSSI